MTRAGRLFAISMSLPLVVAASLATAQLIGPHRVVQVEC